MSHQGSQHALEAQGEDEVKRLRQEVHDLSLKVERVLCLLEDAGGVPRGGLRGISRKDSHEERHEGPDEKASSGGAGQFGEAIHEKSPGELEGLPIDFIWPSIQVYVGLPTWRVLLRGVASSDSTVRRLGRKSRKLDMEPECQATIS